MENKIIIEESFYSINCLMKAAYRHTEKMYVFFEKGQEGKVIINFTPKNEQENLKETIEKFKNDILHEQMRENIYNETKNIRELLLSRALYGLALEDIESDEESELEPLKFLEDENINSYEDDTEIGKSRY